MAPSSPNGNYIKLQGRVLEHIPSKTCVLKDIDVEWKRYAATLTLQCFNELTTVADDPVWGEDSDHSLQPQHVNVIIRVLMP
jgi:hypothetical protein